MTPSQNVRTEFKLNDVVRVGLPCGNDTFVEVVATLNGLGFTSLLADDTDEVLPIWLLPFNEDTIHPLEYGEISYNMLKDILRAEGAGEHRIRWRRVVKLYKGSDTYEE
ncbi:hypothetical protein [Chitinophaga defluvii]|uniref:Immunity protein 8 of polymorphic toxin system n=1 Tax=Chitinophaga defluvii TaxID=3163343 RepID=A0ABV2TCH6_9BACT